MGAQVRMNHLLLFVIVMMLVTSVSALAHEWMAPKEFSEIKNPVIYNESSIARGKEVYLDNCAACHGDKATGLKAEEVNLSKSPPNLLKRLTTHSDGDFYWKIREGRGEMPSFKSELEENDIWDIVNFLKASK